MKVGSAKGKGSITPSVISSRKGSCACNGMGRTVKNTAIRIAIRFST
jgi:hypothetical protein